MKKYIAPKTKLEKICGDVPLFGLLPDRYHGSVGMPPRNHPLSPKDSVPVF